MGIQLTDRQQDCRDSARQFAAEELASWAGQIDRDQATPPSVLAAVKSGGFLGAALPAAHGGGGLDEVSYGLVTEEIGRQCSSIRSLMTVHNMATQVIVRFGTPEQKVQWLPDLCRGERIIAFALTEAGAGTAAHAIGAEAIELADSYQISGSKKWVTYGVIADCFLVFAQLGGKPVALLVDRESKGLEVRPMLDVFGTRGAMLAELRFEHVAVPHNRRLGPVGSGISLIANAAIDHGRFSVAWGSTGIIQACLDSCVTYARERRQGEHRLSDYQLVRRQLTDMLTAHSAARALCHRSALLRQQGDARSVMETSLAKYYASSAAIRVATDAVQLHGANGCSPDYPVARYLRDATVTGIVEGTREMHQVSLAQYAFQRPYLD